MVMRDAGVRLSESLCSRSERTSRGGGRIGWAAAAAGLPRRCQCSRRGGLLIAASRVRAAAALALLLIPRRNVQRKLVVVNEAPFAVWYACTPLRRDE